MTCPLCGAQGEKPEAGRWKEYRWLDCPACGAGFCEPFRSPGPEYYSHLQGMYPHAAEQGTDPMSCEYDRALARLARMPKPLRLLDVGCGGGGFLRRARKIGIDAVGLDFNEARVQAVRASLGKDAAQCASLEDYARGRAAAFDAVTMFQVLEHLDRPGAWLDAAKAVLKPGGVLIIGTPNKERTFDHATGDRAELDNPPHHLTRWNKGSLRAFLSKSGFEVVEIKALAMPPALLSLLLRDKLRLNFSVRLSARAEGKGATEGNKPSAVSVLIKIKEAVINILAVLLYPAYRSLNLILRWHGPVLYAVSIK